MSTPPPTVDVAARLAEARARIAEAGGDPDQVRIVAVTKGFGPEAVEAAAGAGLTDVGENYAQELLAKHAALAVLAGMPPAGMPPAVMEESPGGGRPARPRWHFPGRIQRNKVAQLSPVVSCWQSVARLVEGEAIARRARGVTVLVEVEATGDPGRNGCPPARVPELVAGLVDLGLDVRGLMTVAPPGPGARAVFSAVRGLADQLALPERSMGMSDDLGLAVAEGSTMVRLGRALFGDRPQGRWRPR